MNKKLLALVFAGLAITPAQPNIIWTSTDFLGFTGANKSRMFYSVPAITAAGAATYIGVRASQDPEKTWDAMKKCFTSPKEAWAYDKGLVISTYLLAASAATAAGKGGYDVVTYLLRDKVLCALDAYNAELEKFNKLNAELKDAETAAKDKAKDSQEAVKVNTLKTQLEAFYKTDKTGSIDKLQAALKNIFITKYATAETQKTYVEKLVADKKIKISAEEFKNLVK
jgi:hypothetical protein